MARDKIAAIARILRRRYDPTRYVEPFYIANSTRRTRHGRGAGVSIRVWRDMDALAVCVADQRPGGTDAGDPGGDGFCWECCRPGPEDGHAYVF